MAAFLVSGAGIEPALPVTPHKARFKGEKLYHELPRHIKRHPAQP